MVRLLAWLVKLGLLPARDGWRRAMGLLMREEPARFILSAFGLDVGGRGSDARQLAWRLARFLKTVPEARRWIDWTAPTARVRTQLACDVTLARFDTGRLLAIESFLDEENPLPRPLTAAIRNQLDARVVEAYNATLGEPDALRPHALARRLDIREEHWDYVWRLLRSSIMSIEPRPEARFQAPDFRLRRHPGFGVFNFLCHLDSPGRTADLWVQVHHAGADGTPVQDMLTRLERDWGVPEPVAFPSPEEFAALAVPMSCASAGKRRDVWQLQDFVDFTPLVALREDLNVRLAARLKGPITLGSLILWGLAHHPRFAGVIGAGTVEVPAETRQERSVNFVFIRPTDFIQADDRTEGFVRFVCEFNQVMFDTRDRCSVFYRAGAAAAALPTVAYAWVLRHIFATGRGKAPTLGVSLIRGGQVFVAPAPDYGFEDGFLAVGDMGLPTADGRKVGCVSVKGPRDAIARFPSLLRQTIAELKKWV